MKKNIECPFCKEEFEPYKKNAVNICCKDCDDYNKETYGIVEFEE